MIGPLGEQRHFGHEAEGLDKIVKFEIAADRIAFAVNAPVGQRQSQFGAFAFGKLRDRHEESFACDGDDATLIIDL